jgi:hypothetical protein
MTHTTAEVSTGDALRELASLADSTGHKIHVYATIYTGDVTVVRGLYRRLVGGWRKYGSAKSYATNYVREFSDLVELIVSVSKGAACERVQVDTKHVEAHDEPVYEWRC